MTYAARRVAIVQMLHDGGGGRRRFSGALSRKCAQADTTIADIYYAVATLVPVTTSCER